MSSAFSGESSKYRLSGAEASKLAASAIRCISSWAAPILPASSIALNSPQVIVATSALAVVANPAPASNAVAAPPQDDKQHVGLTWINSARQRATLGQLQRDGPFFGGRPAPRICDLDRQAIASPDPPRRRRALVEKPDVIYYHRVNGNL